MLQQQPNPAADLQDPMRVQRDDPLDRAREPLLHLTFRNRRLRVAAIPPYKARRLARIDRLMRFIEQRLPFTKPLIPYSGNIPMMDVVGPPRERTGVLVLRVWVEAISENNFRARVTSRLDVTRTKEEVETAATVEGVLSLVREWLETFQTQRNPGQDID